jgi:NAD(P)-dependent dehydrogenase (short-subunit alcohol dehydrogenase family)
VLIASLREDECTKLAGEVAASGGACAWLAGDLTDEAFAVAAANQCVAEFGRIDGLFAVAGGSGRRLGDGPLHEVPLDGWAATLRMNTAPAFLAAREAVRVMLSQSPDERGSRGSIVLVGSVLAGRPSPQRFGTAAYAAAKSAIEGLTRSAAAAYAPRGIRVNAVTPGLVATPMAARAAGDPEIQRYVRAKQPLASGMLEADDVAAAAHFFLSGQAARVTGQVLAVDGGWSVSEACA